MAWTAPRTWTTGEIVTAAQMNEQVRDNELYIKGIIDTAIQRAGSIAFIADQPMGGFSLTGLAAGAAAGESVRFEQLAAVSQSADLSGTRALATNYENASGKIIFVNVTLDLAVSVTGANMNGTAYAMAKVEDTSPPTLVVQQGYRQVVLNGLTATTNFLNDRCALVFIVPPGFYYRIEVGTAGHGVTPVVSKWFEWTLH